MIHYVYVMGVVKAQMAVVGTGVGAVWRWIKNSRNVLAGVAVFLVLRFLAGKVLGLYPIDTYGAIDSSKDPYGILLGKNTPEIILWEITFAMVAGQLTKMWVTGTNKTPVRVIIVIALFILTWRWILPLALPELYSTLPSGSDVDKGLAKKSKSFFSPPPPSTNTPPATVATAKPVETLVLMYEGITPCSIDIQYRAKIRTDGDPLLIKFTGVAEWFPHPGKGAVDGPKGVQAGETKFVSADTNRPNVKVWVYKKIFTAQ